MQGRIMSHEIPTSWTSTGIVWDYADPMWPLERVILCCIESLKEVMVMSKQARIFDGEIWTQETDNVYSCTPVLSSKWTAPLRMYFNGVYAPKVFEANIYVPPAPAILTPCSWGIQYFGEPSNPEMRIYVRLEDDANPSIKPEKWIYGMTYLAGGTEARSDLLYCPYNPMMFTIEYVKAIYLTINDSTYLFVNHTMYNGDFTGQSGFPTWNWTSLMAYLGETRILPTYNILRMDILSKWFFQTYKVLNCFRWVLSDMRIREERKYMSPWRTTFSEEQWAATKISYLATPWTDTTGYWDSVEISWSSAASWDYSGNLSGTYTVNARRLKVASPYKAFVVDIDFYTRVASTGEGFLPIEEYLATPTTYVKRKSYTGKDSSFSEYVYVSEDPNYLYPVEPRYNAPAPSGYHQAGWYNTQYCQMVLKFNGRNFKNW